MSRFVVDQVTAYSGPYPYIDGLILRTTMSVDQIPVEHRAREGRSAYTLGKLVRLWLNMFLNFSIQPLRLSALLGVMTSTVSALLVAIVVDKLYVNPDVPHGLPTILATIAFLSGVQLVILGAIGEYLGRLFLDHSGSPQYVVRYVQSRDRGRFDFAGQASVGDG